MLDRGRKQRCEDEAIQAEKEEARKGMLHGILPIWKRHYSSGQFQYFLSNKIRGIK